ncbi:MAG: tRNA uridine-5-carboxymethylaminomethyl(34) synthesis GTPase MnmE [Candidatus Margulisbacteria bacterium]|nr:tRNA uridine-5-carboxymethylaminomethyl(34) synthesis GTPase MnmE [Candidatus Margulisiibacteriota bacterium]
MFHVKHSTGETIAAIATPIGVGGVGIIRISGENALNLLKIHFKASNGQVISSHQMLHGWLIEPNSGEKVDQILACYMKNPRSFTGEDVVELYCHGGPAILEKGLNLLIKAGAHLASRGEFSKRAFLNGKIDLIKAEAVLDLVSAGTAAGAGCAIKQLEGRLSSVINGIRGPLLDILANLEAIIDFPEDVAEFDARKTGEILEGLLKEVRALQSSANMGRIYRHGLCTAIVGRPNVGKSSLLNRILGENRAIVTQFPGTTRDTLEELVDIKGLPVRLIDTAGICETEDSIEIIGVEKARGELESADFVLFVLDGSTRITKNDRNILSLVNTKRFFLVLNKLDLGLTVDKSWIDSLPGCAGVFEISALTGQGVQQLLTSIYDFVTNSMKFAGNDAVFINARHFDCLNSAKIGLENAINTCFNGFAADLVTIDVKAALLALGELSGEEVSEEVINHIFDQFCVGK